MIMLARPHIQDLTDIIWLQTGFLGDIVLQTAAFESVHRFYPQVRQHLITSPLGVSALAGHPLLNSCVAFEKRGHSFLKSFDIVKKAFKTLPKRTSVLLQAHRSYRSSFLARYLGFYTITYEETAASILADLTLPRVAILHETKRIQLLLEGLQMSRTEAFAGKPSLAALEPSSSASAKLSTFADKKLVAIAPGSVWATKRWPIEYFQVLASEMLSKTEVQLLILGSQAEIEAAHHLESALKDFAPRVSNLAGKTSLEDLRVYYPRLALLISNDSSPIHYASAFSVPTLAIFGATVPGMGFGPLAQGSKIAEVELSCRPCSDHGPAVCPLGHFNCMRQLLPMSVLPLVLSMLSS